MEGDISHSTSESSSSHVEVHQNMPTDKSTQEEREGLKSRTTYVKNESLVEGEKEKNKRYCKDNDEDREGESEIEDVLEAKNLPEKSDLSSSSDSDSGIASSGSESNLGVGTLAKDSEKLLLNGAVDSNISNQLCEPVIHNAKDNFLHNCSTNHSVFNKTSQSSTTVWSAENNDHKYNDSSNTAEKLSIPSMHEGKPNLEENDTSSNSQLTTTSVINYSKYSDAIYCRAGEDIQNSGDFSNSIQKSISNSDKSVSNGATFQAAETSSLPCSSTLITPPSPISTSSNSLSESLSFVTSQAVSSNVSTINQHSSESPASSNNLVKTSVKSKGEKINSTASPISSKPMASNGHQKHSNWDSHEQNSSSEGIHVDKRSEASIIMNSLGQELNGMDINLILPNGNSSPKNINSSNFNADIKKDNSQPFQTFEPNNWGEPATSKPIKKDHKVKDWSSNGKDFPTLDSKLDDSDLIKFSFNADGPKNKENAARNAKPSTEKVTSPEKNGFHSKQENPSDIGCSVKTDESVNSESKSRLKEAKGFEIGVWNTTSKPKPQSCKIYDEPAVDISSDVKPMQYNYQVSEVSSVRTKSLESPMKLDEDRDHRVFVGPSPCLILQVKCLL